MRSTIETTQLTLAQQAQANRDSAFSCWLNMQPATSRRFSNPWRDGRMARRYREQIILKVDCALAMTAVLLLYGQEEAPKCLFWRKLNSQPTGYLVVVRDTADKHTEGWQLAEELFSSLSTAREYGTFELCHFESRDKPARTAPIVCRWAGSLDIADFPNA